jgi:hypothetical protein
MSAGIGRPAADSREHVVQFYSRDDELTDSVGGYLSEALASGSAVVVLATLAHRTAFGQRMEAGGADVAGALARGDFVALDAAATMAQFLLGGRLDPGSFWRVIGDLLRPAAATGRPVQVYGEMVALLWEAGQVSAAIELEALWNELGRQLSFSLICAYPAERVRGVEHADELEQVCGLHSAVVGARPGTEP